MRTQTIFLGAIFALLFNTTVHSDVVTDWNSAALDAIRHVNTPPPAAARNLAILHAAVYDAVNGIRRTHEQYFVHGKVPGPSVTFS